MSAILALSVLLFAQAGTAATVDSAAQERDVAYTELTNGETQAAITRLEAALVENPDDPALLINLGSAYAEIGNREQAARCYEAAATSDIRYRLELANGDWIDSRRAARMAMNALKERELALN